MSFQPEELGQGTQPAQGVGRKPGCSEAWQEVVELADFSQGFFVCLFMLG